MGPCSEIQRKAPTAKFIRKHTIFLSLKKYKDGIFEYINSYVKLGVHYMFDKTFASLPQNGGSVPVEKFPPHFTSISWSAVDTVQKAAYRFTSECDPCNKRYPKVWFFELASSLYAASNNLWLFFYKLASSFLCSKQQSMALFRS